MANLARPTQIWLLGTLVGILGLVSGLAAINPGGWRDGRSAVVTVRSSSGLVINTHATHATHTLPPAATDAPGRGIPLPTPSDKDLPPVAALTTLRTADAIVTLPATITPTEVTALLHLQGISAIEEVDTGTVSLAGTPAVAFGVDPGTFRQFTPEVTATQDELWRYVAGGALVTSYAVAASRDLPLGREVAITPAGGVLAPTTGWLGAMASFGLPGVDLVVSHAYSDRLGLTPDSGLIVSGPSMDPNALEAALTSTLPGSSVELIEPTVPAGT